MVEVTKNKPIVVLIILTIIFLITSVSSCINLYKEKAERDKEMALRMDLEEKMSKFSSEKAKLEVKIYELNQALEVTQKALSEEQESSNNLRDELEKLNRLKDTLEENLKDALVNPPAKR